MSQRPGRVNTCEHSKAVKGPSEPLRRRARDTRLAGHATTSQSPISTAGAEPLTSDLVSNEQSSRKTIRCENKRPTLCFRGPRPSPRARKSTPPTLGLAALESSPCHTPNPPVARTLGLRPLVTDPGLVSRVRRAAATPASRPASVGSPTRPWVCMVASSSYALRSTPEFGGLVRLPLGPGNVSVRSERAGETPE